MESDFSSFLRLDAAQNVDISASGASFATSTGDIFDVSCYGPGLFRMRAGPRSLPDYGLVTARTKACAVAARDDGVWTFAAGDATLEIAASPLSFRLLHRGTPILSSITDQTESGATRLPTFGRLRQGGEWTAAFALASGEPVYGLGEKFGSLNKRGQILRSIVADARGVNTGLSAKNAPFAWSPGRGAGTWGVFVDTPGPVVHGVAHPDWSHRSYALRVGDEALDLFVLCAESPAAILALFGQLTGRAAPVPRWSLGLWVWPLRRSAAEAADAASKLRARRIPCDVLGLDASATWENAGCFDFAWDRRRLPEPRGALEAIKRHALRIAVCEWPYIPLRSNVCADLASRGYLLNGADGTTYVVERPEPSTGAAYASTPAAIVDFTHPGAYVWWRDAHAELFADGVDALECEGGDDVPGDVRAFNGDSGERLHNVFPLLYSRCALDATAKHLGDGEPALVGARAGWTGSQRCPTQWSGDAQSDWEGLAASIRGALSWGMSGMPYHGVDVGGTYGGESPSAELCVRWLQAAVFASHLRVRGSGTREPWALGPEAEAAARKWLAFRYRLVPYLERVVADAAATGLPVMRAMALAFPGSALARDHETQFMCGDALLVAPIVREGGEVDVALPPGAWYDLNSRQRFPGQRVLRYKVALDQFPAFGREGHALPLGRPVQHTGEIDAARPLSELWVFGKPTRPLDGLAQARIEAGADGAYSLRAAPDLKVELFGDAAGLRVGSLG